MSRCYILSREGYTLGSNLGTSLAVRWLRLQGAWVRSLVEELRFHMLYSVAKKISFFLKWRGDFPGGPVGLLCIPNAQDLDLIPGWGTKILPVST